MGHIHSDPELIFSILDASDPALLEWMRVELAIQMELKDQPPNDPARSASGVRLGAIRRELNSRGCGHLFAAPRETPGPDENEPRRPQRKPPVRIGTANSHATRIMYVECKTDRNDRGGARICRVRFSKSRRTLYVGGLILESCRGSGVCGNYVDVNSGLEYWVSGPKKNGRDRDWAGGGEVRIDPDVVDEYWRDVRNCEPPANPFIT